MAQAPLAAYQTWREIFHDQYSTLHPEHQKVLARLQHLARKSSLSSGRNPGTTTTTKQTVSVDRGPQMVKALVQMHQKTSDEVERRNNRRMGTVDHRLPHRVRIMKQYVRPESMPEQVYLDELWSAVRCAEGHVCERSMSEEQIRKLGGTGAAYISIQSVYGSAVTDSMLKCETDIEWRRRVRFFQHGRKDAETGLPMHPTYINPILLCTPRPIGADLDTPGLMTTPTIAVSEQKDESQLHSSGTPPLGTFGRQSKSANSVESSSRAKTIPIQGHPRSSDRRPAAHTGLPSRCSLPKAALHRPLASSSLRQEYQVYRDPKETNGGSSTERVSRSYRKAGGRSASKVALRRSLRRDGPSDDDDL